MKRRKFMVGALMAIASVPFLRAASVAEMFTDRSLTVIDSKRATIIVEAPSGGNRLLYKVLVYKNKETGEVFTKTVQGRNSSVAERLSRNQQT